MLSNIRRAFSFIFVTGLLMSSSATLAGGSPTYQVTITNLTNAISFTPILVASHRKPIELFDLGTAASDELTAVAEGGATGPLQALLHSNPDVIDVQISGGLLGPGESVMVILNARHGARYISVASMMLPTNDGFIALDSARAPSKKSKTYFSPGYDAGTELNDENCDNIPGPTCGGDPFSAEDGEGYVHIHRGIHGIENIHGNVDLPAYTYDWRNPVAKITIIRTR
jgi:hypothetical protein